MSKSVIDLNLSTNNSIGDVVYRDNSLLNRLFEVLLEARVLVSN